MARRIKRHLTYTNLASTLALFAVIAGGTAFALPGKHRVTADDLKKNSVRAAAIAKSAVRTGEVKNGQVGSADVGDGQIKSADVGDQSLAYQDLGQNSVIARMRTPGGISTGDGGSANPAQIPLTNNSWTQAANEVDIFFAEITYTTPTTCTGPGGMNVRLLVDGKILNADGYQKTPAGQTITAPFLDYRPYLFEPGAPAQHTATVQASDSCTGLGENFNVSDVKLNLVAVR